uniref:NADP-dependent oxidoreductase n=1 Tax=Thermosporothrix sp. COM3 TaxID=2490863 RepID=A0A455SGA1_9CHLR|nr:NADP-dependent oxidoreductase [Thermosporothrix sp. COM3]
MSKKNRQIVLASRPQGWVQESNFRLVETDVPALKDGEVLVKNIYLSLDPYMRGRMNATKSYASSVEIGQVMVGGTVGKVEASKNPQFREGDAVLGYFGWQEYGISDGKGLQKLPESKDIPLSAYLGVLGMPGLTAWVGLIEICQPKPGETVVVSAASGAVGSVVGQLAKAHDCCVVGIAGGPQKCNYIVQELGFDKAVDHRAGNLQEDLEKATPNGIDIDFENVGGEVMDTILGRLNTFARIALCGMVSQYNETQPAQFRNFGAMIASRVKMQGFLVGDYQHLWPQAQEELTSLLQAGKLKYRESIAHGVENAPKAFIGMLKGENFGKQLVKLSEE